MGRRFHHEFKFHRRALDLYLSFSVLSALLVAAMAVGLSSAENYASPSLWSTLLMEFPVTLTFLVLSSTVLIETRPFRSSAPVDTKWGGFFLTQFFLVLGLGFEHQRLEFFYLATMPIMAFLFFLQSDWFSSSNVKKKRATLVMGIALCSLGGALYYPEFRDQWPRAAIILLSFGLWQWGTIYLANVEWLRLSRQTFRQRLRLKGLEADHHGEDLDAQLHPITSERYFFHDLINHTHGIQLFLRGRMRKQAGLDSDEVKSLSQEVEALQQLVHEHFGLSHKNLNPNTRWRSFKELLPLFQNTIHSFLPREKVEVFIYMKGLFNQEESEAFIEEAYLPVVASHRILTNLVKNCAEAKSQIVEISFEGFEEKLLMTIKNDVFKKRDYGYELGKTLEGMISNERTHQELQGLGLESIEALGQAVGGSFHFFIEEGSWVSKVEIPYKKSLAQTIANVSESHKKTAA